MPYQPTERIATILTCDFLPDCPNHATVLLHCTYAYAEPELQHANACSECAEFYTTHLEWEYVRPV